MTKHMDIHCQTRIFNSINYDTKYKICVFTPKNIKKNNTTLYILDGNSANNNISDILPVIDALPNPPVLVTLSYESLDKLNIHRRAYDYTPGGENAIIDNLKTTADNGKSINGPENSSWSENKALRNAIIAGAITGILILAARCTRVILLHYYV